MSMVLRLATSTKLNRAIEEERLLGLIRELYVSNGGVYGSPRVFVDLREA